MEGWEEEEGKGVDGLRLEEEGGMNLLGGGGTVGLKREWRGRSMVKVA